MMTVADGVLTRSVCGLRVDGALFGIDTSKIREVLRKVTPQAVPLAPTGIAGLVMYRGDVLTIVSLRSVLGIEEWSGAKSVLVMDDETTGEIFGLAVDAVEGVLEVPDGSLESNPSTLDEPSSELFCGTYRSPYGLMVRLNTQRLMPSKMTQDDEAEGSGR